MPVTQLGQINTTALIVPDLYVQIVPPSTSLLNGLPTNILGIVGTATWGPVNAPTIVGNMASYSQQFGAIQARKYDLGTGVAAAVLQGANNMRCVRVTDGTDVAASSTIPAAAPAATGNVVFTTNPTAASTLTLGGTAITFVASGPVGNQVLIGANLAATLINLLAFLVASSDVNLVKFTYTTTLGTTLNLTAATGGVAGNALTVVTTVTGATPSGATLTGGVAAVTGITITAKYTGSLGNSLQVIMSAGSQAGTTKVAITLAGLVPEVFDNISGSGNALWTNMAAAFATGISGLRGPSQLVTGVAGAATAGSAPGTYAFTGGTDGATTISGAVLIGQDTIPRKGMYCLRNTGTSVAFLADCDDTTTFSLQVAYGFSEGTYMIGTTPAGDTITTAVANKAAAGIDAYIFKYMFGDWVYFNDTVNNQVRLISPQGFVAGRLANLSPQNSSLNKPLYGIVGTGRSYQNLNYSSAELTALGLAGIDVITNPIPAGNSFGVRFGHNSSSNAVTHGDNYTRMTNYLAYTLNGGMGIFVGQLQSATVRAAAAATISSFLDGLVQQNMIGNALGTTPYTVQIDANNNPPARVALGYMQADVKVQYLSVIEYFLVNIEGGQSVTINRSTAPAT